VASVSQAVEEAVIKLVIKLVSAAARMVEQRVKIEDARRVVKGGDVLVSAVMTENVVDMSVTTVGIPLALEAPTIAKNVASTLSRPIVGGKIAIKCRMISLPRIE
jgi:hypothetical protein